MIWKILTHKVPWDGDKIRLYRRTAQPDQVFIGEFWLKIDRGAILVVQGYIRRDLPKWSNRFGCWEYFYDE